MLQIVASLIDAARGVIYDRHMFIVQVKEENSQIERNVKKYGNPKTFSSSYFLSMRPHFKFQPKIRLLHIFEKNSI
jgi:hypothetical protein